MAAFDPLQSPEAVHEVALDEAQFKVTVDLVVQMAVYNPFDFFLEPAAENFPFDYAPALKRCYVTSRIESPRLVWDFDGEFKESGLPVFDATGTPVAAGFGVATRRAVGGVVVSTVHCAWAGVGSVLPSASEARTSN